jgi:STE24 endopeptidase
VRWPRACSLAVLFSAVFAAAALAGIRPAFAAGTPKISASILSDPVDRRVTALSKTALLHLPGAKLVDPRRQEAARTFRTDTQTLFLIWAFSQILAFFYLWGSGTAARLRDALRRMISSKIALRFSYGAALAGYAALAAFPSSLAQYKIDLIYGLTSQPVGGWLHDSLLHVALDAIATGLIVAFILALVDQTRLWYLYGAAGLFAFTLGINVLLPVVVSPLFNRFTPLAVNSRLRQPIRRIEAKAGIGGAPIEVADLSARSEIATADVSGFGPTRRIVVSDTLLQNATPGEVVFLLAREFARYTHGDGFRVALYGTFLFILCTGIGVGVADRIPFRRDDDPLARLTLVGALLGSAALVVLPAFNVYERHIEDRADRFGILLTGDRASAVRAFVRFADDSLSPLCPSRAATFYFLTQPPFGSRIARAQGRPDPCR